MGVAGYRQIPSQKRERAKAGSGHELRANRIARLAAPRSSRITRQEIDPPGAGQASVRVVACGVCASELHAWEGPLPVYPGALGHEPVGVVEETGPGVTGVSAGDLVTGRAVRHSPTT